MNNYSEREFGASQSDYEPKEQQMSDDIVERLRLQGQAGLCPVCLEAADEIKDLRSEIFRLEQLLKLERLRAGRAAVVETKGFCWSCGATPRYQHKDGCRASGLRALKGGAA
jgi:hypothetical protein